MSVFGPGWYQKKVFKRRTENVEQERKERQLVLDL